MNHQVKIVASAVRERGRQTRTAQREFPWSGSGSKVWITLTGVCGASAPPGCPCPAGSWGLPARRGVWSAVRCRRSLTVCRPATAVAGCPGSSGSSYRRKPRIQNSGSTSGSACFKMFLIWSYLQHEMVVWLDCILTVQHVDNSGSGGWICVRVCKCMCAWVHTWQSSHSLRSGGSWQTQKMFRWTWRTPLQPLCYLGNDQQQWICIL